MAKLTSKKATSAKPRKIVSRSAQVLGVTRDGVRILKPKGRATNFTQKELREIVASVVGAKRA